jgi:hypothetical protein
MVNKNNKNQEGIVRVWLGEDGIVYTYLGGVLGEKEIKKFVDEKIKVLKTVEGKTGSFADLSELIMKDPSLAGTAKRMIVGELKELEGQKIDKMAVYGKGIALKVIGTILGMALGLKETQSFTDKEKALEWLKGGKR